MDPNLNFQFTGQQFIPSWNRNPTNPGENAEEDEEHFISGSFLVHIGWGADPEGNPLIPSVSG